MSGIEALRRAGAELRGRLQARWTRILQPNRRLPVSGLSGITGFERFMLEFEAHNRRQRNPPKRRNPSPG